MTDAEWAVVRPLMPVPGWLRGRDGQPEAYCHRAMLDAIRYLVDNGITWRGTPVDFPPWDRVYSSVECDAHRLLGQAGAVLNVGDASTQCQYHGRVT